MGRTSELQPIYSKLHAELSPTILFSLYCLVFGNYFNVQNSFAAIII